MWQLGAYLLYALLDKAFAVEQAVGIMDVVDQLVAESSAAQSHEVDATVAGGFFTCNDKRRDVLAETASTLYHHIAADVAELVAEHRCTDDGEIIDNHFSGKFCGVADDASVADDTVVGDVHVLHEQVVRTHLGASLGGGTP